VAQKSLEGVKRLAMQRRERRGSRMIWKMRRDKTR
jgi:hypothetical protein